MRLACFFFLPRVGAASGAMRLVLFGALLPRFTDAGDDDGVPACACDYYDATMTDMEFCSVQESSGISCYALPTSGSCDYGGTVCAIAAPTAAPTPRTTTRPTATWPS